MTVSVQNASAFIIISHCHAVDELARQVRSMAGLKPLLYIDLTPCATLNTTSDTHLHLETFRVEARLDQSYSTRNISMK